jgi:hypothetical protein
MFSAAAPLPMTLSRLMTALVIGDDAFIDVAHIEQLIQHRYRFEIETTVKDRLGMAQAREHRPPQPVLVAR